MTGLITHRFTDAQRMELRSYVQLAGEAMAQYWPMRTFIHHNPLHGLESLPFDEAVELGRSLFDGRAYLSNEEFRRYFATGRIAETDLRKALEGTTDDKAVCFAGRRCTHVDILTASMRFGLAEDVPGATLSDADASARQRLTAWLQSTSVPLKPEAGEATPDVTGLPAGETLATWCDRTLGTAINATINRELVKWCSAFMDEGEAAWTMPGREHTFYRAWRSLATHDLTLRLIGIRQAKSLIRALPDRPEDAVLLSLHAMDVPKSAWEPYLTRHLAALPGWTGYIKWRSSQTGYPWQEEYPIDLVQYVAVRLFYEQHLVQRACEAHLAVSGRINDIRRYMNEHPAAHQLRRAWIQGHVPEALAPDIQRLYRRKSRLNHAAWDEAAARYETVASTVNVQWQLERSAEMILRLARAYSIDDSTIETTSPSDMRTLLGWLGAFPPSAHGPVWLEALEASHRRMVLNELGANLDNAVIGKGSAGSRPLAQVIFCIDVRSEVFRRHLEHVGGYETLGLAGFFGVPLDYQPFTARHAVSHCPVLLKPKNKVREVPRSYHGVLAERHKIAAQLTGAAQELLHDLKENVVTPYVMVEALGWLFGLPFFARTLFPRWYGTVRRWFAHVVRPAVATTLTVEKLARKEAEEMIAAEHQAVIREIVRNRFGFGGSALSPTLLEKILKKALGQATEVNGDFAKVLRLTPETEAAFLEDLRERHLISPRGISVRLDRLTHTGFSTPEQAYFVEAALRLMGLTRNFSRLVVFCAHGSTSENNPYESALDCGACGGNPGLPNSRVIAAMANKAAVRELLSSRGITIPNDTQFLAAQHDTTTDAVTIVDLEDVPATHRKDIQRLAMDLDVAGQQAALERAGALLQPTADARTARRRATRRSQDWAEVRPEWGLSRNSMIIVGGRALTQNVNLQGRSFLHSYDSDQDSSGKLLETIMTAPLVVAQWINMEHYFSTVDNERYGSGSKIYHNVVGRIGVMSGVWSDLRIGLPAQTVLNGASPYHEPMRLLAIIEAPRERIYNIIQHHPLLEQLFHLKWMSLLALDPRDRQFYRYDESGWKKETPRQGGSA